MALPDVLITLLNNQLGQYEDIGNGLIGHVMSGPAPTGLALSTPKELKKLQDAVDIGIDEAYDTANTVDVYEQIAQFYAVMPEGTPLWIMLVAQTTTMEGICDKTGDLLKKLRNAMPTGFAVIGVSRTPDDDYVPAYTKGYDDDVYAAMLKAQVLADEMQVEHKSFRVILSARNYQGNATTLANLKTESCNRVHLAIYKLTSGAGNAAIGFLLGHVAKNPVHRLIWRVKNGDLKITDAYFTNGALVDTLETDWNSITDKGYIFARKFVAKSGYFFSDDPSAAPASDDYNSLARGRVIDKVDTIAYTTFVEELGDDFDLDDDGKIPPVLVKSLEGKIEDAILDQMRAPGKVTEISNVKATVKADQDVLGSNQLILEKVSILPKGYSKNIIVPIGYAVSL